MSPNSNTNSNTTANLLQNLNETETLKFACSFSQTSDALLYLHLNFLNGFEIPLFVAVE